MPYNKITELPERVRKNLPEKAQEIWLAAFDSSYEKYGEDQRVYRIAWGAVKRAGYKKDKKGKWRKK